MRRRSDTLGIALGNSIADRLHRSDAERRVQDLNGIQDATNPTESAVDTGSDPTRTLMGMSRADDGSTQYHYAGDPGYDYGSSAPGATLLDSVEVMGQRIPDAMDDWMLQRTISHTMDLLVSQRAQHSRDVARTTDLAHRQAVMDARHINFQNQINQTYRNSVLNGMDMAGMSFDPAMSRLKGQDFANPKNWGTPSLDQLRAAEPLVDLVNNVALLSVGGFGVGVAGAAALATRTGQVIFGAADASLTISALGNGDPTGALGIGGLMGSVAGLSYGMRGGVAGNDLTIAANAATGNPAAISRGFGTLNSRQAIVLAQLPESGSSTLAHKAFGQRDLTALTAATGDEFAMFSTGGRRLIFRGDAASVPINPDMALQLSGQGWRWSSHTHPGLEVGVLRSSPGDQAVLRAMGGNQSAIFNSVGQRGMFTPDGDSLNGWKPW